MKIGIILPGFSADKRDWCIPALYNFVRTLAARNEIHVFALEYPYRREQYNFFGAFVHALGGAHRGKLNAPRLWTDALSAIFAEQRRGRFDLLHAFWVNKPGVIAGIAARVLRLPFVAAVAGGELVALPQLDYGGQLHRIERAMIGWVMNHADCVTVGSLYLQKLAARWREVKVMPLGVDTERFSVSSGIASKSEVKIVNVASLNPVKAQNVLLDAFSRLDPGARLQIIGAGEQKNLRAQAENLGIASRVEFSGEVAHDALSPIYHDADVFVQSSLHEAQGMAVLEAVASGRAIAGTPVGVLPELAQAGAAIAAEGFDANALAYAIHHALDQRKDLGCRARQIAEKEYSLDATYARWIDLYHTSSRR